MADQSRQRPSTQEDFTNVISSVTLWQRRPLLLSGHVLPFILAYAVWWAVGMRVGGEIAWWAGMGVLGGIQVLAHLTAHWSIAAKCFFTCCKVSKRVIHVLIIHLIHYSLFKVGRGRVRGRVGVFLEPICVQVCSADVRFPGSSTFHNFSVFISFHPLLFILIHCFHVFSLMCTCG